MFCSNCGKKIEDGQKFCPYCGNKLEVVNEKEQSKIDNTSNSKPLIKNKVFIIIIIVLILIIVALVVNFFLFKKVMRETGHFEKINGVDTYIDNGSIVTNSLVRIRGKKIYYVDENGHKIKNAWEIINNDGDYGYFGSLGELIKNKVKEIDGKLYYFDENGILKIDTYVEYEDIKYHANSDGELTLASEYDKTKNEIVSETQKSEESLAANTTVVSTTVAATTVAQTTAIPITTAPLQNIVVGEAPISQTTQSTTVATSVALVVEGENGGPGVSLEVVSPASTVTKTVSSTTISDDDEDDEDDETEVDLKGTTKITDTVDGDDYECTITILKPIMVGKNTEETENLSSAMDEAADMIWEEVESLVNDYSTLPKSVIFNNAELGTVNSSKIYIFISGTINMKSGSTKSIKYRIVYDRDECTPTVTKTS